MTLIPEVDHPAIADRSELVVSDPDACDETERTPTRRQLLGLAATVAVGRLAYSAERTVYHLVPDEPASLGVARWLSGTGDWNMFAADVWRPGAAVLFAPLYWITDDQTAVFRLTLALGGLLGGAAAVVLALLLSRLTSLSRSAVLVISGGVALMPANLSASAFAWAEPMVTLSFLLTVWHLVHHAESLRRRHLAGAVLWASIGLLAHSRLMPLVVLAAMVVLVSAVRSRRWDQVALAIGLTASVTTASQLFHSYVVKQVWESPGTTNSVRGTLGRLTQPLGVLDAAAGQVWYMLASTAMLAGLGAIQLSRLALDRSERRSPDAQVIILLTAGLVGTSVVFMADRFRTDHLVYGRYNDAIIWPLIALGAAWLVEGLRRHSNDVQFKLLLVPVVACASLALLLLVLHRTTFELLPTFPTMIAGVQPLIGRTHLLNVGLVTTVSILAFVAMVFAARRSGRLFAAVCILLLVVGGVALRRPMAPNINFAQRTEVVAELAGDPIPIGSVVGVRIVPDSENPSTRVAFQRVRWYLYQWFLDDMRFETDSGVGDGVGPYVFSTINDSEMERVGAQRVWIDPEFPVALWREPEHAPSEDGG